MTAVELDPADPLGADLLWGDDVDPTHRMVSGVVLLAHDLYHRVITPRGRNVDDDDYGLDIRSMLHRGVTATVVAQIPSQLAAECRKDERVASIDVRLTDEGAGRWRISFRGQSAKGPFEFVAGVDEAGSRLLSVGGG